MTFAEAKFLNFDCFLLFRYECWCNSFPLCVLEIVDRNSHGLICLLVHTERNSPCKYRRLCCLRCTVRRTSPKINYVEEKNELHPVKTCRWDKWSEGDDPSKVYCRRKAISSVCTSEEINCSDGRRGRSEDVAFFLSFIFHSFES